eukprot:192819-Chlamydomonas_euryale.AAC.4
MSRQQGCSPSCGPTAECATECMACKALVWTATRVQDYRRRFNLEPLVKSAADEEQKRQRATVRCRAAHNPSESAAHRPYGAGEGSHGAVVLDKYVVRGKLLMGRHA